MTTSLRPEHWFDRLLVTRGEEVPLEVIPLGPRKPLALHRRPTAARLRCPDPTPADDGWPGPDVAAQEGE